MTHHELPGSNAELDELAPDIRARLATIWLSQAATEARVARSFEVIHESLVRLGSDDGLVALAARAIDDEHRHAALSEDLAGRYAGRPLGPYRHLTPRHPTHSHAKTSDLRDALYVVGQCALNETFASAYLSAAFRGAKTPLARAALRELLEDEVEHARLGWAFLTVAPASIKRELDDWLVPLTICNLREWRRLDLPSGDELAEHGIPPAEVAHAALAESLEGILVPGFRHVGLDTRALEGWVACGARYGSSATESKVSPR